MSSSPSPEVRRPRLFSSHVLARLGWFVAFGAGLLSAFLDSQNFALKTTVRLKETEVELAAIESKSLKQQLAAERILASRQIADLTRNQGNAGPVTFVMLNPPVAGTAAVVGLIAWQPSTQSGVFVSNQLPLLNPHEEYRLWIDSANSQQIDAGPIAAADPAQPTKAVFKSAGQVTTPIRFTLTRGRSGEVTRAALAVTLVGSP